MKIHVAIVDDKEINRATHKLKLTSTKDIEVVLESSSGNDFLNSLQTYSERIDVVLMDIEMPGISGIETIFKSRLIAPHIKFIVITIFEDIDKIFNAIKAGAHGYLLKEDSSVDMVDAIHKVFNYGAIPMSPSIARKAMQLMVKNNETTETQLEHDISILSEREKEILNGLIAGKEYKKIGEELFISPYTVRRHVSNIYEKLHVNSRSQIINLAYQNNWK